MTTDIAAKTPEDVAKVASEELAKLRELIPDKIETGESAAKVDQIMKKVGRFSKRLETRRGEMLAPSREVTSEINGHILPIVKEFEALKKFAKTKLVVFQREQQEIERKRREAVQAEQEKEAARLREEAKAKEVAPDFKTQAEAKRIERQAEEIESREVAVKPAQVFDQRSLKTSWRAEVIDLLEVPAMYMIADQKALDALARESDGKNPPPGVVFKEKM